MFVAIRRWCRLYIERS